MNIADSKLDIMFYKTFAEWKSNKPSEKTVEFEFYSLLKFFFENELLNHRLTTISYSNPYYCDGLITIRTIEEDKQILIEAKSDKSLKSVSGLEVLSQALYYLRQFNDDESNRGFLPSVVVLFSMNEGVIYKTDDLLSIVLDDTFDWSISSGSVFFENENIIEALRALNIESDYVSFNERDFSITSFFNKISDYLESSELKRSKTVKVTNTLSYNDALKIIEIVVENNYSLFKHEYKYRMLDDKYFSYRKSTNEWVNTEGKLLRMRLISSLTNYLLKNSLEVDLVVLTFLKEQVLLRSLEALNDDDFKTLEELSLEENTDYLSKWFTDTFEDSIDSVVTFDDALQSYNDFLVSRGNKPVSARFFSSEFLNHHCYSESKYPYKKKSNILKDLNRSPYITKENPIPTEIKSTCNYFIGLKFKR